MKRCDWRGPVCMTNKEPDRLVGWDFTTGGRTIMLEPGAVEIGEDGCYRVDGKRLAQTERLSPIIEGGADITVRRGCAKRAGHRGDHGWYLGQRTAMRLTTDLLAKLARRIHRAST